jgi:Transposase and inactivated derivatives
MLFLSRSRAHDGEKGYMSRFHKLSHVIWHCQYNIVWIPKYRYRVMTGPVADVIGGTLRALAGWMKCEVNELKVMPDHVHMVVMVPPTVSISKLMGELKGRSAIQCSKKSQA